MKLELKLYGKILKEFELEQEGEYFLGRSSNCDIALEEEVDLSRKHLRIYQKAGSKNWHIEALTEKSELYFNGQEITQFEIQNNCFFNLKNYVLSFTQELENHHEEAFPQETLGHIPSGGKLEDKTTQLEEGTQIMPVTHLLYCLRISIEGEFSDYVNLNLGEKWIIGRAEECDVSINYDLLTRKHLEVYKKEDRYYVKDLGSTNKSYLNGVDLVSHKGMILNVDDEITVSDLKIVFEIRDTNYKNKIQNLPAQVDLEKENESQDIVVPKVVLEDFIEEDSREKNDKNKKIFLVMLSVIFVLGMGVFLFFDNLKPKKKVEVSDKQQKLEEQDVELLGIYESAQDNLKAREYFACLGDLENLHNKVNSGFYEDSQSLQNECQRGLNLKKQKQAEEKAEQKKKETEEKIQKLAMECQEKFKQGEIKTESELNECAKELFDLDPTNAVISAIKVQIQDTEIQKQLEKEKKQKYRTWIQSKRNLYNKARKINKEKYALKAVAAYDRFLNSARGIKALKNLYEKAESERNKIQKNYDSTLRYLREACSALTENQKFKEAYPSCLRVLKFRDHDQEALSNIEKIKAGLIFQLKPTYEKAQWHESFGRIDPEAKRAWTQILEKDIEGGYYYKKASSQLKKYD